MFPVHSYRKLQSDPPRGAKLTKSRFSKSSISARLPPVPEQPKTQPKLTMKVKELRNWLSDFGDKNQEHYRRLHSRSTKVPSSTKSIVPREGDDLLGIQSKPSVGSSCPSTAILEDNNDPLFAASFSSDEENGSHGSDSSTANNVFHHVEGAGNVSSKEHLKLLLKQAPRTQEGHSYSVRCDENRTLEDDRDDVDENNSLRGGVRESSLFRDQILTKATLDKMSGNATKTLREQLAMLKEEQRDQKQDSESEKDSFYHGDDEGDSKDDSNSSDSASIGPGVLVSKMANVFLNNHSETLGQAPIPLRRRLVDPRDLAFLRGSSSLVGANGPPPMPREDLAYANPPKTPTTTVGKGIRKFGGPPKTLVQRRTEQLHQKFGETRSAVFVQKKTWGQKVPHGKYQRTTRVEKVYY